MTLFVMCEATPPDYDVHSHEVDIYLNPDISTTATRDAEYDSPWWWKWWRGSSNSSSPIGGANAACLTRIRERISLHFHPVARDSINNDVNSSGQIRRISRFLPSSLSYLRPMEVHVNKASSRDVSEGADTNNNNNNFRVVHMPPQYRWIDVSRAILVMDSEYKVMWLSWLLRETEDRDSALPTDRAIEGNFTVELDYEVAGVLHSKSSVNCNVCDGECTQEVAQDQHSHSLNTICWPQTLTELTATHTTLIRVHIPGSYNVKSVSDITAHPAQNATVTRVETEEGEDPLLLLLEEEEESQQGYVVSFHLHEGEQQQQNSPDGERKNENEKNGPPYVSVSLPMKADKCKFKDWNSGATQTPVIAVIIFVLFLVVSITIVCVLFAVRQFRALIGLHGIETSKGSKRNSKRKLN